MPNQTIRHHARPDTSPLAELLRRAAPALALAAVCCIHAIAIAQQAPDQPTPQAPDESRAAETQPNNQPDNQPAPNTAPNTASDNAPSATRNTGTPTLGAAPSGRTANNLAIVPIRTGYFDGDPMGGGMIDNVTATSVKRRIAQAETDGADAIVFEIDTPGGSLPAVLEITEAIRATNLYTIAWINTQAISGGAVIALACDEIIVHDAAVLGDAGIVTMGRSLGPTERAKVISPLLADLVDSARRNGYDEVLVQALVSLGVETWEVRNTQTGERYFLTRKEYEALFNEPPPESASPYIAAGGEVDRDWQGGAQFQDDPTMEGLKQADPGRADFVEGNPEFTDGIRRDTLFNLEGMNAPATDRPDFAAENPDNYTYVRFVTSGDTFLTMQAQAMRDLGFAAATINSRQELRNYTSTEQSRVRVYNRSFPESYAKFMTMSVYGTVLSIILIIVFLLSLFIELSAPGMGVFGTVALVALGLFISPHLMINAAAWWMLAAIALGIGLILVEAFVTPGFGIPGVSGLILLLLGLVGSFAGAGQAFPGAGPDGSSGQLAFALAAVLLALFAAGAGMYLISRYTKAVPIAGRMILSSPPKADSMLAAMNPNATPADTLAPVQPGDIGTATSTLRPSGSAEFEGQLVSVVAERGMIDKGTRVRVTDATRYRVAVVPATEDETPPPEPTPHNKDPRQKPSPVAGYHPDNLTREHDNP